MKDKKDAGKSKQLSFVFTLNLSIFFNEHMYVY